VKDFQDGEIQLGNTEEFITPSGLSGSASNLIPAGVPIVCTRMGVGRVASAAVDVAINQDLKALYLDGDQLHSRFALRLLDSLKPRMEALAVGSTVKGIDLQTMLGLSVQYPPIPEQARIAEVLDTLDEAIRKTEDILLKRQLAKQGLLHDLLRVGLGENGEIRDIQGVEEFKATEVGMIPSTWTVKSLDQIATNHDGKRIPLKQADRVKRQGPYPYYGASGVIDSIDDYLFDGTYVLLGEDGENVVSRNIPLAFLVMGKFWPNNHAHVYEPQPGIKAGFLVELLEACDFSGIVSGSAQPKLTQEALRRLRFAVPPPPEQDQILKLIDASNEVLIAEKQQLEMLNQMKSGLSADLLTGRIRTRPH
jgi:type I restriction enzyme S subunit